MNQVSPVRSVFIGTDVACARGKKVPICAVAADNALMPLAIPGHLAGLIPLGAGNREIDAAEPFREAAQRVANAIIRITDETGWMIERIAIDAPAAPPPTGRRTSERELTREGLPSFATPDEPSWADIFQKCRSHLRLGGSASTLPHANNIWMLYGFKLFASLKSSLKVEVIEVYPFAIIRELLEQC